MSTKRLTRLLRNMRASDAPAAARSRALLPCVAPRSAACALLILLAPALVCGATSSTVVLKSSSNPSIPGQQITLTAVVSPSSAAGKVAFYDDVTVLGSATLSGGQALLKTGLLPSGKQKLKAWYEGDSTYAPSQSLILTQTVNAPPQIGFQPETTYDVTSDGISSVAAGDFNNDGRSDLAVITGFNDLIVYLGSSGGGFARGAVMALNAPRYVTAADLNQDGKTDLVVTGENTTFNVSVLIGNGDGTFQAPIGYGNTCCSSVAQLAVADFNGDGFADVALAFTNGTGEPNGIVDYSGYLVILPGAGDGTLKDAVQLNVGVSVGPYQIAAGDFNGDGKPDIATAVYFSTNAPPGGGTVVLLGNGDGTFQAPTSLAGMGTTVGDFNGDGIDDLAVWNLGLARVYPGSASGIFGSPIDSAPASRSFWPRAISTATASPTSFPGRDITLN